MEDFKSKLVDSLKPKQPSGPKPARDLYYLKELDPNALKVLFLVTDEGGCGFYRGLLPAAGINRTFSTEVNVVTSNFITMQDYETDGPYPPWNVIVHQRQDSIQNLNVGTLAKHKLGSINVYEADDDFFHMDPNSQSYRFFTPDRLERIRKYIRECDYVTVTNAHLKDVYGAINPNVAVIPNAVDVEMFASVRKKKEDYDKDDIIIGWTGSATHTSDLKIIADVIKDVLKKHKNVKFLLAGWPECPFFTDVPFNQIIRIPWVNNMLDHIQNVGKIDIGLCPLVDNKFNRSKSNLKYIELAAAGIPAIVSDVITYNTTVKNGKNGIVVGASGATYKEWIKAIETLITQKELRKKYGVEAYKTVVNNFDINVIAKQWVDFYKRIVK